MTIGKGDYSIAIQRNSGMGKNYGLYVGYKNRLLKCGSFSSDEKASIFTQWVCYLTGHSEKPREMEWMTDGESL